MTMKTLLLLTLASCGGAYATDDRDPACILPEACASGCEMPDGTSWRRTAGGYIHEQTIIGNDSAVVSTVCAIDLEGRRIDR